MNLELIKVNFSGINFPKVNKDIFFSSLLKTGPRGAWVAQSVKRPTSARSRSRGPEFEPRVGLWADGSEPGACFRFCVSLSLCPSPVHALSLSVPKINKKR